MIVPRSNACESLKLVILQRSINQSKSLSHCKMELQRDENGGLNVLRTEGTIVPESQISLPKHRTRGQRVHGSASPHNTKYQQ